MFREMRRFKQQLPDEECIGLLRSTKRGVLSVIGDGGYPYAIPMNHWYCEQDGKLYFHGAKQGHKHDALARCDKVCYCVYDEGYRNEGEWALNVKSVVVFGRMKPVTDEKKAVEILTRLTGKFTDDEEYLRRELESAFSRVQCLELTAEHITGKRVKEE